MSKKLLFAIMAVVLCVGLVGGAFSYFTAKVPDTNNVLQAGTLSMQISNDGTNFYNNNSASFNLSAMVPGVPQTTNNLWLKNTGTMDIPVVYASITGLTDSQANLSKYIEVLAMNDDPSTTGTWESSTFDPTNNSDQLTIAAWFNFWTSSNYTYSQWAAAGHPYISLYDLEVVAEAQAAKPGISFFYYAPGLTTNYSVPFISVGGTSVINFKLELADNVPTSFNTSPGATSTFGINFYPASEYNTTDSVSNYLAP
jgi:archaellum component FlaG (FlaF/FlaG flagellin family)